MILHGEIHPDFGQAAETIIKMLPKDGPGGAALCVYHYGEKVVDIWGGTKDKEGSPWERDTLVFSASTTKGVTSTLLHILIDRGLADYDDPIAKHWPEFAQNGKGGITIRHALCHQAGLYNIADYGYSKNHLWQWSEAIKLLEQATPVHEPGLHSAYHGITYGHIIGGLIEKLTGKPFQEVLKEELADPLDLDGLFIGVPSSELSRLAKLITLDGRIGIALKSYKKIHPWARLVLHYLTKLTGSDFTHFAKALAPDFVDEICFNDHDAMQAIIPAANGAFTARSLAKMYAVLANGGELDGKRIMSASRIEKLNTQQSWGRDKVINLPMNWRLGYHQILTTKGTLPNSFGHFGFGGSGAWCDPSKNLAMAMTINTGIGTPTGDFRTVKIARDVVHCAIRRHRWHEGLQPVPAQ